MASSLDYLSLISALSSSNSVQSLYSTSDLYSASNLYESDDDSSVSFDSIFGSCVDALQNSNTSLLTDLASTVTGTDSISEADAVQFIEKLEEASHDTCDCDSADLVKNLYEAYLADTASYAKNRFNSLISAISSETDSGLSSQTSTAYSQSSSSATAAAQSTANPAAIEYSIPTEEEIDALIEASLASLPA